MSYGLIEFIQNTLLKILFSYFLFSPLFLPRSPFLPSLGLWVKHVEPYQLDNGRLTQENIALHQQIMTLKESLEQRTKDLKASMRHLEHENADLKFLNNQYMQRLIAQEKESHAKSERILELQEKNSQPAIVQTPGGRKRTLPYRHQRMEMDSVLPVSSGSTKKAPPVLPMPNSQLVDILKRAEDKMEELQLALDSVRKEIGTYTLHVQCIINF